jgi:hypothetical protein
MASSRFLDCEFLSAASMALARTAIASMICMSASLCASLVRVCICSIRFELLPFDFFPVAALLAVTAAFQLEGVSDDIVDLRNQGGEFAFAYVD